MNTEKILGAPDLKWKSPLTQQGDCLIKKCGIFNVFKKEYDSIPKDATEKTGNIILKGQINSHALYGGNFQLLEKDDVLFIRVNEATVLDHVKDQNRGKSEDNHHAQWIPPGEYFFDGVFEYDHILEESRQVID